MLQHGRKSKHSQMLSGITDVNWPPPPPTNINERAQREWIAVTSNLGPADMPRESFSLFAVWCCLKAELDDVMLDLAQFPSVPTHPEYLKRYRALIRMRTTLTHEFSQLSSKLRLTPYPARSDAARRVNSGKPWEGANGANEQDGDGQRPRDFSARNSELDAQARVSSNAKPWPWRSVNGESAGEEEQP